MGYILAKFLAPFSPVEENNRIIGNESGGSYVDKEEDSTEESLSSMLKWCRTSGANTHSLLQRSWLEVPHEILDEEDDSYGFRIMQWNVLADALGSGKDNFIRCPPEAMTWKNRKLHILEEMLTHKPDIICCQEIDHFSDFFQSKLKKAGFEGAFLSKPWSPCLDVEPNNGPDGCAIFFRSDKFELLEQKGVTLKSFSIWRNHVALFHLLKFKKVEKNEKYGKFLVGSTHLKAKVGYESMRTSQGRDLLTYLTTFAEASVPIIMCGDFNATPTEEIYKLFCESEKPYLESVYSCLGEQYDFGKKSRRREPEYTTWCIRAHGETPKTVDYIWYSKPFFRVRRILKIPTEEEITKNRLPSAIYPSDHVSLVCDMNLVNSSKV